MWSCCFGIAFSECFVSVHRLLLYKINKKSQYFTFDNKKHISIGSFPEVADRVISIFGVSKSYAMSGWRIGYIVANKDLIAQIMKIHDSLVTCPTAVSQYAALAAITGKQDAVQGFKRDFEKRRQIVVDAL